MKKNSKHIANESGIDRFLNGGFTEKENQELENWINENPENRNYVEELRKIWDRSKNLKDFQSADTNEDWLKIRSRINFEETGTGITVKIKERLVPFLRIAAVIIIVLGIGFLMKQIIFNPPDMILVSTGDSKNEVILPDGSSVVLNRYSELKYPEKFQGRSRQVDLKGEGYFCVVQNPGKVFRIKINTHAIVEVLGTSFNLRSDSTDSYVDIHVINGRVAFFTPAASDKKTVLSKGEQAILRNGVISVTQSKDVNFLSWKTGILSFNDEKIENVLTELAKFYNKEFMLVNTDNKDIRLTSRFDNQELGSVLEEMKLVLKLDYALNADTITFYSR